eukprot:m.46977 g.46977  ORF g.46977 m.46977 type:complete len:63 (+) comp47488_c0_seq1:139-327(+)
MAKSKNHTAHNQNKKDHRNGIKKVKTHKFTSLKGLHQKFVKNLHYARKHTPGFNVYKPFSLA